jgi:hypothetical protein
MKIRLATLVTCVAAATVGAATQPAQPAAPAGDVLSRYLTPEGNLRASLEIRDEKRGFGTFAGTIYRIEPNGQWTITRIFRNRSYPYSEGALPKAQLKKLAGALAQFELASLPSAGRPLVNPHVLTIAFGERRSELIFGVDLVATRPSPSDPEPAIVARYGGIADAVRGLLQPPDPRGVPAGR